MKKLFSILLVAVMAMTFFACNKDDGDLGKQTTVDKDNGYTLVQEVKPFKFSQEEDALKGMKGVRVDGFKVTKENADGGVKTKADAIEIACKEATENYNQIQVFFDRTTGIWKVELQSATESATNVNETVYVDEDGYTLLSFK